MTQGQFRPEPSLDELIAESRAAAAAAIAEMGALGRELAVEAVEARARREAAEERHAEKARSGELGPEQRRLQERMDLGETTWTAVFDGSDDSAEAAQIRVDANEAAEAAGAEAAATLDAARAAGSEDPRTEIIAITAELRATVAALNAQQNEENSRGQ